MDDNESLGYVSSVDPFQAEVDKPSVDAADEKALVRLVRVVDDQIAVYNTLSGVKQFSDKLTLQQRFELCDKYIDLLHSHKQLLINAIDGVKEKQNNG